MTRTKVVVTLMAALLLFVEHAATQQITLPIDRSVSYEGTPVGKVNSLGISAGRLTVSAVLFPDLFAVLDSKMSQMGDLERDHWSQRIYWVGNTHLLSTAGQQTNHLMLATRIRYEQWAKVDLVLDTLKTRLFRDTKTVEWRLWIPQAELSNVVFRGKVLNIRNFPNWLESTLDLRVEESLNVALPVECGSCNCDEFAKSKGLTISSVKFVRLENDHVTVEVSFNFTGDIDISECWSL